MKPKNIKERRNNFLKFLALFILTMIVVIAAVFFTFKTPVKENQILRNEAERIRLEMKFQDRFADRMNNVKKLIDSLDTPGAPTEYLNVLIGKDLADMQKAIPKDSAYRYDMYSNVVKLYVDIQDMKGKLRELKDAESTIEEYKEALEKSREEFKQLERDLLIARNSRR
ncbi:MAG: hypothetical protein CR968_01785 [Flavobacteriia bacterium]|nr:MAG: hypothetical protein CR968_01785 [Flavobacteriia bacterium]